MRLFLAVQKYGYNVGVRPFLPDQKIPFNRRSVEVLLIYSLFIISSTAFLAFDANSFREYTEAFFPWMSVSFTFIGLSVNILMTNDIFRLVNSCEEIVERGKQTNLLKSLKKK